MLSGAGDVLNKVGQEIDGVWPHFAGTLGVLIVGRGRSITGVPAVTHLLLERGANPDEGSVDWTPVSKAVHEGNAAIVEDLLAHHARIDLIPSYGENNPLHVAAKDGNRTMCELLLRSGANPLLPNKKGLTAADLNFCATKTAGRRTMIYVIEPIAAKG